MKKSLIILGWSFLMGTAILIASLRYFNGDSADLMTMGMAVNLAMFIVSMPSSIILIPVVAASSYYMNLGPTTAGGIYLLAVLLSAVGSTQWYWIARFWRGEIGGLEGLELYEIELEDAPSD